MTFDFSHLFHFFSKDHSQRGTRRIPPNEADWPLAWKTAHYKSYPRFPQIALDRSAPRADFFDIVRARRSRRSYVPQPVDRASLSRLLLYSCGITKEYENKNPRRAQPSGGGRYPIEVYPLVRIGSDIPSGLYHYNVRDHALETLWERSFSEEEMAGLFTYQWARAAPLILLCTAIFDRTQMKYGERGYRYVLIEAGHIGQNICLVAESRGLASCPLAGTRDEPLERLIDIDGVTESIVYAIALGYPQIVAEDD